MNFGYVVNDTDLSMQLKAIRDFGCDEVVNDNFGSLLSRLSPDDKVVVWRVDKLAICVSDLTRLLYDVHGTGASIELLCEGINISKESGGILIQLIDIMNEVEKSYSISRAVSVNHHD